MLRSRLRSRKSLQRSLPENGHITLDYIKEVFDNFFTTRVNNTFERFKFFETIQQEGESVDSLLTKVQIQAKKNNFEQLEESLIRDQVILGVNNDELRSKLLIENSFFNKSITSMSCNRNCGIPNA